MLECQMCIRYVIVLAIITYPNSHLIDSSILFSLLSMVQVVTGITDTIIAKVARLGKLMSEYH